MADVVYSKIVELLDNTQYIAALQKAEQEEKVLAGLRDLGGKAAVKAHAAAEKAAKMAAAAHEKALKDEGAALAKVMQAQDTFVAALLRQKETAAGLSSEQKALNDFIRKTEAAFKSGSITASQYSEALSTIEVRQQQLATTAKPVTGALTAVTAGSKSTAAGMQQLSFQLNDVVTQLASGAAPMQVLAQQGGQIVGAFQSAPGLLASVVDKVAALGPALAVTGAALSPLIFLWKDYTDAKNAATDADKRWQAVAKDGDNVIKDAAARVRELNLELAPLTDQQRELERTSNRWKDATAAGTAEIDKQIRVVEAQIGANQDLAKINAERKANGEDELELIHKTAPEYAAQTELLEKLRRRREQVTKAGKEGFEAERRLAQLRRESAEQDKAIEEAERALEDQRKEADKNAEKREREQRLAYDEAIAYLHKEEVAERQYFENLGKAQEEADRRKEALRRKELDDFNAMMHAEAEAEARRLDESEARYNQALADKRQGLETLLDASRSAADALAENNEKASKAAFKASQVLGYGQAAIAALKTGGEVAAQLAPLLGPAAIPAGVAAGVAAGAAFAIPIASMEPPSFTDTPGPVRMGAANGTSATFAAGDTVVAARTPDDMLKQVLAAVRERPGPAPSVPSSRRRLLGPSLARDPVARSLTSDLWRVTRGALPPG